MHRLLQLLCAGALLTAAAPAFAAFSLSPGYPYREGGESRPIVVLGNPLAEPRAGFNRADCLDAAQTVQLALTDIPAEATDVELWVRRESTSCADPAFRPGGANLQCWRAAHWTRDQIVNKKVSVSPTAIVAAIDKQMNVEGPLDASAACAKDAHMVPVGFNLQIMAFNAGTVVGWSSGTTGAVIAVPTAYDLAGPAPPKLLVAEGGSASIALQLESSMVPPVDWAGHDVYCFPTADSSCAGHALKPAEIPAAELDAHVCSTGSASVGGAMTVTGLKNGTSYAVALAARDKAGNHGPLSNVLCATTTEEVQSDTGAVQPDALRRPIRSRPAARVLRRRARMGHRSRRRCSPWQWSCALQLGGKSQGIARAPAARLVGMSSDSSAAHDAERIAALEAELASLRTSRATLEALVESVPDFVVRLSTDGAFEYVNRFAPGLTREQVVGRTIFEFTPPEDHARIRAALERVTATGEPVFYETTAPGASGPTTPYFNRIGPLVENGRVTALTCVTTDVSELRGMARRLADHRDRIELAAAASDMGYWRWDSQVDVVVWDATTCRHFGLTAPEERTTYRGFLERVHPADRERIQREVDDSVACGHYSGLQFRTVTPSGDLRWLMTAGRIERDGRGQVQGLLGCVLDVTDRRRLEERLLQAQRLDAVGQLAAGVAHNFNNLLAALIPALEITVRKAPDGAPLLREVLGSAQRSAEVVRQLTAFAGGKARADAHTADASDIARRVVELARGVLDRAITLELVIPDRPALARVDSGELEHALMNLVLNARDALESVITEGRPARISVVVSFTHAPEARVQVQVTDVGIGMTETVRRRAIEPFFTTKSPERGTGLGLSTVYAMVTAHGGQLDVESTPGVGTTITLQLPAGDFAPVARTTPGRSLGGRGESVLLVDDDRSVRRAVATVLDAEGYRISDFGDPHEALAAFAADPTSFHVAIVDQSMPGLSGQALLDRMRAVDPSVRAISFSGNALPLQGARFQLTKPVAIDGLLSAVRRVLDEP